MRIKSHEAYEAKRKRYAKKAKTRKSDRRAQKANPPMDNQNRFQPIVQCFELPKAGH
jgi:hypothetical protein